MPLLCPHPSAPSDRERRRPCPSWPEQLPQARSAGQLAGAVTKATAAGGPGGWRAPGRPPRGPSPGVGCARGGMGEGGVKSAPPPHSQPRRRGRACRVHLGPFAPGCGGPQPLLLGRTPAATQVARARAPFFSRQVCGSPAVCPPFHALTAGGGAAPPHPHRGPGPPASALPGCTPFSPARTHSGPGMAPPRPLCPRQPGRGEKAKGERKKKAAGWPQT